MMCSSITPPVAGTNGGTSSPCRKERRTDANFPRHQFPPDTNFPPERGEIVDRPLHVFGLGKPELVTELYHRGVDSVDSSSYVQLAVEGRLWSNPGVRIYDPTPIDRLHFTSCNLAMATGQTLPLGSSRWLFSTAIVERLRTGDVGEMNQ